MRERERERERKKEQERRERGGDEKKRAGKERKRAIERMCVKLWVFNYVGLALFVLVKILVSSVLVGSWIL